MAIITKGSCPPEREKSAWHYEYMCQLLFGGDYYRVFGCHPLAGDPFNASNKL